MEKDLRSRVSLQKPSAKKSLGIKGNWEKNLKKKKKVGEQPKKGIG